MKLSLFHAVGLVASSLTSFNTKIGNFLISCLSFIFNGINSIIQVIATGLFTALDKERFDHAKMAAGQFSDLRELDLLIAATKVKEDALSRKAWTVMHTIAINKIGNELYARCQWEPARIHKYLKGVVESIPGMVYMGGDDFEEGAPV